MGRQAHGKPLQRSGPARPRKRKPAANRGLNALELAEQQNPDKIKIRQHRLGEVEHDPAEHRGHGDRDERSSKRRKTIAEQEEDEQEEDGSDLEGNRWHLGVDEDDADSDIDSEAAFGESDEELVAGFTFRGSKSMNTKISRTDRKHRRSPSDDVGPSESGIGQDGRIDGANDSDGTDGDDLGEDAVDLATAWDLNDAAEQEAVAHKQARQARGGDMEQESDQSSAASEDSEELESESDEVDAESQLSVSDEDDGDHSKLQRFVEGLGSSSKASSRLPARPDAKSVPGTPSQFGASSSKLSAADLLQYIKDPQQRRSLKILQTSEERGAELYQGGVPGKLAPPLAKRQQDRLDREAAYEESKKELSKWIETVKRNRRAEHLSFPLADPAAVTPSSAKQLAPTSQSQPMTSLESTIQEILMESGIYSKESGSAEGQEQAYEALLEKKMPLEEVQARRAELRKARDLMFREEIRARRIKKIKSKAYRRVHRKERDTANLERKLLGGQGLIDSEEEREQNDRRRAEERMGARHRESKWAKSVKASGRAGWDEDARHGVTDLARRDEELRRRIEGRHTGTGTDGSGAESSDSDDLETDGDDASRLYLEGKLDEIEQEGRPEPSLSRLGSMAFMQKAEAARKAANDEEIRGLRRSLGGPGQGNGASTDDEDEARVGRQRFGVTENTDDVTPPRGRLPKSEFEERLSDDDGETDEDGPPRGADLKSQPSAHHRNPPRSQGAANVASSTRTPADETLAGRAPPRSQHTRLPQPRPAKASSSTTVKLDDNTVDDYTSPSESDNEDDATPAALAKAIFAGPDDVVHDFEEEKKETVDEEGDHVIDNTLPGWGSWTGAGISKKEQKRAKGRFLTTIKGVSADKRQDATLDRVIINEKRVKKNTKYLATELPHPFETRQQYERSLRLPLGPEWTTKSTFQDATKPRVLIKQGIIRPMTHPLA